MKVEVSPDVLAWARTSARLSIAEAAKKIGISEEKLRLAEEGKDQLTYAQLKNCGRAYSRPAAVFFLDNVVDTPVSVADFRLHDPHVPGAYSSRVSAEIRRAIQMREDALMLYSLLGMSIGDFDLVATLTESVDSVADRIRKRLGVATSLVAKDTNSALKKWKNLVEKSGVLVFEVSRVPSEEMRGMCISFDKLPIVVLNGGETSAARLFSLLHEYTHVLLRQSALCDMGFTTTSSTAQRIEVFCNAVSAATLMPTNKFTDAVALPSAPRAWSEAEIETLASEFNVSREAVLRRMLTLGYTTSAFYQQKRREYRAQYEALKARRKETSEPSSGGPAPSVMTLRNRGRRFTSLVLDAYHSGQIGLSTVSDFLGLKIKHLDRLESLVEASA